MAVSYIDRQTLSVIAPTVQAQLGIDDVAYGWLVSAFSIAYLVGAPIAGRVIDRVGARRGLLVAVLVWSGVAALHTLVPGFGVLFGLRIALGIAESPSFPGAAQTIHRALPPKDRPPRARHPLQRQLRRRDDRAAPRDLAHRAFRLALRLRRHRARRPRLGPDLALRHPHPRGARRAGSP
jgi:MFS family permease